jgi:HK97 family phage major capsid protein
MAQAAAAIRDMREKQQNKVRQARAVMDGLTDASSETDVAEANRQHDAFMVEYDQLQGRIDREEQLMEREAKLNARDENRPHYEDRSAQPNADEAKEKRAKAFRSYLRYGTEGMTAEERQAFGRPRVYRTDESGQTEERAQGIVDGTAGGYLVPEGFNSELIVSMKAYGPMLDPGITREIATASGNIIPWPSMDDTANQGRRLSENTQVNPTQVKFGVNNLYAYKYTTDVVLVSNELLADSGIDPEQIIRDAMAIRMGRIVNSDLTVGTGASMPTGISYAATAGYTAASSTAIAFDDMIETEHSLDPDYRKLPGVRWQFHDTTLKALRKLKDGDGQYIWQPASVIAKAPATILGYDYEINQAMAQIATGQKSVIFGDHQRYVVRRVREFMVRRLVERYADFDQVGFIGFARYDGAMIDKKGFTALVHP